jgi:hypothetical protein
MVGRTKPRAVVISYATLLVVCAYVDLFVTSMTPSRSGVTSCADGTSASFAPAVAGTVSATSPATIQAS